MSNAPENQAPQPNCLRRISSIKPSLLILGYAVCAMLTYFKFDASGIHGILLALTLLPAFAFLVWLALYGIHLAVKWRSRNIFTVYGLPLVVFIAIFLIHGKHFAYVQYKIRAGEFQRDLASIGGASNVSYKTWPTWSNSAINVDQFVFSKKNIPENQEVTLPSPLCKGNAYRLEGDFYVFFADCNFE